MTMIPNTTQVPHLIIRKWMPKLSDVELRVLLVVVDQTLGWVEDEETGRRKDRDWISRGQLMEKTGRSAKHVSKAVKSLVEEHQLVEAVDAKGKLLNTAEKRQAKFGKIFYRLTLHEPAITLFDKPLNKTVSSRVSKGLTLEDSGTKSPTQKGHTTKETLITKEIHCGEAAPEKKKGSSPHKVFMDFWWETVKRTRGIKPIVTAADARNLKRVLDSGVDESLLEQLAVFFLADYSFKKFSPTISTFASSGIINGLLNRTKNDPEFHKNLYRYADQYIPRVQEAVPATAVRTYEMRDLQSGLKQLATRFAMPTSV